MEAPTTSAKSTPVPVPEPDPVPRPASPSLKTPTPAPTATPFVYALPPVDRDLFNLALRLRPEEDIPNSRIIATSAVPLGLLAAKFCKSSRNKVPFVTLMLMPLFVPADIMGSSLLVFFKNLNGFFEWLSDSLGVTWFYGWFELGFLTALIGQIVYTLPYAFIVILITMSRYRVQQTEAARSCGATAWQAFRDVEFPQIRAGVFSACAFVTILSFNEATRTALLKGGFDTFQNVLVSQMLNIGMSGESYAMAGIMSVIPMVVIGSILIITLIRSDRLERVARAKAAAVMSN
ncbi:MAG: ABC transporter permease [Chloroflexi bacterium]|nr:MAG: ABC transporter permease [Chloroflexota bacterium]